MNVQLGKQKIEQENLTMALKLIVATFCVVVFVNGISQAEDIDVKTRSLSISPLFSDGAVLQRDNKLLLISML